MTVFYSPDIFQRSCGLVPDTTFQETVVHFRCLFLHGALFTIQI